METILRFTSHNIIFLVASILFILYQHLKMYYSFVKNNFDYGVRQRLKTLVLLSALYPVGKLWQLTLLSPQIFRFYLGDIGFIPFICIMTSIVFLKKIDLKSLPILAWIATIIAIAFELVQIGCDGILNSSEHQFHGQGDYLDLVVFVVMGFVTLDLVYRTKRMTREREEQEEKTKHKKPHR